VAELSLGEKVKLLGQAYVEGHKAYAAGGAAQAEVLAINKKIYQQDPSIMELWRKTREWSLDYFAEIYQRLGSRFDRFYFESEVAAAGLALARQALTQGILRESEEAVVFEGYPYGLDTRVFITREGLPTYEAKELGLAALEFTEFGAIDKCVHVVAPEQTSFFKVTFKVEELLGITTPRSQTVPADRQACLPKSGPAGRRQEHFAYGYVDLKEGKMSSRAGHVVAALEVMAAAKEKALSLSEKMPPSGEGSPFTEKEREELEEAKKANRADLIADNEAEILSDVPLKNTKRHHVVRHT
jgi:arginyl-tRNA synthetase